MPGWSPYNYVLGNPISLIDPDGRMPDGPGDPPIVEKLRSGFGSAMDYLREQGADDKLLSGTENAFNNMVDNLMSGEVTVSGEVSATIGARLAGGARVSSPVPLVPLAAAQGDINLGSVELLTLKFDLTMNVDVDNLSLSIQGGSADAHGLASSNGPNISFGARGAAGTLMTGGIDVGGDVQFSNTKGNKLSVENSVASFSAGGAEYVVNFQERSVQVSSKVEVDMRVGAIVTFSGKLGAGINGKAKF